MDRIPEINLQRNRVYVFFVRIPSPEILSSIIRKAITAPYPYPEPARKEEMRRWYLYRTKTPATVGLEQFYLKGIEKSMEEFTDFFGWRVTPLKGREVISSP